MSLRRAEIRNQDMNKIPGLRSHRSERSVRSEWSDLADLTDLADRNRSERSELNSGRIFKVWSLRREGGVVSECYLFKKRKGTQPFA